MGEYRFEFEDSRTREKLGALPLYGLNFNSYLVTKGNSSRYGDANASVRSDSPGVDLTDILNYTEPGRVNLWMFEEDQPVWGGIVWNRVYQSQGGGTFQLYAQTFDSYLMNYIYPADRTFTNRDARNIICDVWNDVQGSGDEWDVGLVIPTGIPDTTPITKAVVGTEDTYAGDVVREMVDMGAEYRIMYSKDPVTNRPIASLELGRWDGTASPLGVQASDDARALAYPGEITNYWYSESASKGGTHFHATGKGMGVSTPRSFYYDASAIAEGRLAIAKKINLREVESQANLDARLVREARAYKLPMVSPTFKMQSHVREGEGLMFETKLDSDHRSYNLGDFLNVVIRDPNRFATPLKMSYRAVSKTFDPQSSEYEIGIDEAGGM